MEVVPAIAVVPGYAGTAVVLGSSGTPATVVSIDAVNTTADVAVVEGIAGVVDGGNDTVVGATVRDK